MPEYRELPATVRPPGMDWMEGADGGGRCYVWENAVDDVCKLDGKLRSVER